MFIQCGMGNKYNIMMYICIKIIGVRASIDAPLCYRLLFESRECKTIITMTIKCTMMIIIIVIKQ